MQFFNIHTHKFSRLDTVLEIVNQYPQEFDKEIPFYSVGIHPWYIQIDRVEQDLKVIEQKLQSKQCLALGECGLDKRIETPLEVQIDVFKKQLLLAIKYNKPVILHCVSAYQEIIDIKKRLKIEIPMIIHGFSKNKEIAKQLLDNGFYLSFGKYLLLNPELEKVFVLVPNHKFFLETDTINATIEDVYSLASQYKNIKIDELKEIINSNFNSVFKIHNL